MAYKRRVKNKVTTPRIIAFIAYTLILFFGATIIVNMNPNANEDYRKEWKERNNKTMKWIFQDNNGKEYDIFDTKADNEHGAAMNYDYLMPPTLEEINAQSQKEKDEKAKAREEKRLKELLTWKPEIIEIKKWETAFMPSIEESKKLEQKDEEEQMHGAAPEQQPIKEEPEETTTTSTWWVLQPKEAYKELWDTLEDRSAFLNMVFEYMLSGKLKQLPEWAVRYVVTLYWIDEVTKDLVFEERACMTPWWYELEHGQSVLAYQQRADSINVCNIERRVCKNGKLSWSYNQQSCDETLWNNWTVNGSSNWWYWTVTRLAYTTYNSQKSDELRQPPEAAINDDKQFDVHGQLITSQKDPILQKMWNHEALSPEKEEVAQERSLGGVCKTPWWEKVQPGQFVKAYRFQNGFTDIPCQVQLRTCVDWKLEWMYQFSHCDSWETSYEDFLYGYMDNEQPSPQRLLKMLQTDLQPDPEYWNNLSSELIDKMLRILRDE